MEKIQLQSFPTEFSSWPWVESWINIPNPDGEAFLCSVIHSTNTEHLLPIILSHRKQTREQRWRRILDSVWARKPIKSSQTRRVGIHLHSQQAQSEQRIQVQMVSEGDSRKHWPGICNRKKIREEIQGSRGYGVLSEIKQASSIPPTPWRQRPVCLLSNGWGLLETGALIPWHLWQATSRPCPSGAPRKPQVGNTSRKD